MENTNDLSSSSSYAENLIATTKIEKNNDNDDDDENDNGGARAATSVADIPTDDNSNLSDWEYAKEGIAMWLNNDPDGAEEHFKSRKDNTKIFAGYAFTTVMNAVISYELDKIEIAQTMLRDLELRCSPDNGWIQSFRTRIFGSKEIICKPFNDELEEKIILADCLMCSAILTFLTQDISGLMRGSWLLRKAWKIYQQTYTQIFQIYETIEKSLDESKDHHRGTSRPISPVETDSDLSSVDENILPHLMASDSSSSCYRSSMIRSKTTNVITSKSRSNNNRSGNILRKSLNQLQNEGNSVKRQVMSHLPKNLPSKLRLNKYVNSTNSTLNYRHHHTEQSSLSSVSSSSSLSHSPKSSSCPSKSNLFLDLKSNSSQIKNGYIPRQVPLSCPEPEPLSTPFFTKMPPFELSDINLTLIKRLMGAVSFGYGLFQLSISLLPPNLMRLISLFGFEGNQKIGVSCLTYSNNSQDMRAPLARLALLWFYTIGAQLFHVEGANLQNEIHAAKQLLKESQEQYATSAIFLFFRARIKRLQCNTNVAIEFYDAAYRMSAQKELKLLCLHEVGWCRLIQLDFGNAMLHFHELRLASNFSKSFYTYMTTICQGAFGHFDNLIKLKNELVEIINKHKNQETQIDKFIMRRIDKLPSTEDQKEMFNVKYFKFFIYEMLFLWNTLYSCTRDVLNVVISDCSRNNDNSVIEPTIGLSDLILGCCEAHLQHFSAAITALRQCIEKREGITDDIHVSAFAHYELAILLIKEKEQSDINKQEAKIILSHAQRFFKNYDFENRLSARIYSALKNLQ